MGNSSGKESVLQRPLLRSTSTVKLLTRTTTLESASNPLAHEDLKLKTSPLFTVFTAALRTASRLSNLLPTAVFLLFQILTPLFTNGGNCADSQVYKILPIVLLCCCFLICLVASLTDSFTAANGEVHHGFLTPWGLWTPHISGSLAMKEQYQLTWIDLIHAGLSLSVFVVLAFFDRNIRYCLYPGLVSDLWGGLLPILIGFVIAIIFMVFPTKRRGLGFLVVGETYLEVRVDGIHNFEAEPAVDVSKHVSKVIEAVVDTLDDAFDST